MMIIATLLFRWPVNTPFPCCGAFFTVPRFIGLFVTLAKMSSTRICFDLPFLFQLFKKCFSLERNRKPLQFLMYFLTFLSGLSLVSSGDSLAASRHWNYWKGRLGVPYFSNDTKTKVLATLGHTTYLHCVVGNLGDRQVNIFPF